MDIKISRPQAIFLIILALGGIWFFASGGFEEQINNKTAEFTANIEQKVRNDLLTQYEFTKKHGTASEIYVQSSFIVAHYLQAKDEANYKKWKTIARQDAKKAGVDFLEK